MSNDELNVTVLNSAVGFVKREGHDFLFAYGAGQEFPGEDSFVSLTMPVRHRGYLQSNLHPIFEMHLPEGYLRSVIVKQFAKLVDVSDFGLLKLMSPSLKGRLAFNNANQNQHSVELDELLNPSSPELFSELITRYALSSPLSGVQPKVIAPVSNKATLGVDNYIVKAWGSDYPELALNEYFCMRAVQMANVPVPTFYLSNDDALFIMKRFDLTETDAPLGFEDMCVLQGKPSQKKYDGSYEGIVKTLRTFCASQYLKSSIEQFFKMVVLNNLLKNGDAHLKNFGVIYETADTVRLAPAYDVISTTAYIKNDMSALLLAGSKRWWSIEQLVSVGVQSFDLSQKRAEELVSECLAGVSSAKEEVRLRLVGETNTDKIRILEHFLEL